MDLELTDVQQELGAMVRRLLAENYDASVREELLASEKGWSEQMWQQYAELGLLGLPFPEEFGGAGMGIGEVAVVMEEFGRALVLEPYLGTVVLGGGLLMYAGTDEQKAQFLPGVAEGTTRFAFAGYEPFGRYDLTSPSTTATAAGECYTLSGEKIRVLGGDAATGFIVSAAVDGQVGLFLLEADAEGVKVDVRTQADGHKVAAVVFDNAPAARLGAGDATEVIGRVIDIANTLLMAEAVGAMAVSLDTTVEYIKTREQFGAPIGRNQVLQHRAADMYAALEDARSMALYAKLAITQDPDGTSKTRHTDIVAAKLIIDQSAELISKESIQMHGGNGMTMEYPIGHYAKRLTVIPRTFDEYDALGFELSSLGGLIEPKAADA
ncbi:acyl-CoA dehydrogenase family protein [Brevibacterium samyangense]|uniref:Pimeloyl-CoA dehydrogenase small subunit n=1 Tax=Brevibacterium samyangense TaxID=366888 RepID=A0ABN2TMZ6_9MICO